MPIQSCNPPVRTRMREPGPADVHPRVLAALGRPTVGHLDPAFVSLTNVILCIATLGTVLNDLGYRADTGAALAGTQAALAD